jgi:hypothetical protein
MAMPQDTCIKITPISISTHPIKMLSYDSLAEAGRGIDSKKRKAITLKVCKPRSIYSNNNH